MPEVQKLCCNCQHFEFDYESREGDLTFCCEQDRFNLKGRALAHGQFLMYMYMGQKCDQFKVIDFTGPKGRAGLPSGESFGGGGSISAPSPPE